MVSSFSFFLRNKRKRKIYLKYNWRLTINSSFISLTKIINSERDKSNSLAIFMFTDDEVCEFNNGAFLQLFEFQGEESPMIMWTIRKREDIVLIIDNLQNRLKLFITTDIGIAYCHYCPLCQIHIHSHFSSLWRWNPKELIHWKIENTKLNLQTLGGMEINTFNRDTLYLTYSHNC